MFSLIYIVNDCKDKLGSKINIYIKKKKPLQNPNSAFGSHSPVPRILARSLPLLYLCISEGKRELPFSQLEEMAILISTTTLPATTTKLSSKGFSNSIIQEKPITESRIFTGKNFSLSLSLSLSHFT
jgi:hypothetical protein